MKVYIGQTRSRKLIRELTAYGFGECVVRNQVARRKPFFQDNGAFEDFKAKRPFDAASFEQTIARLENLGERPDFVVAPDIVAGGMDSLAFSATWMPRLRRTTWPIYLAVQDGMTEEAVAAFLVENSDVAGLFVGGSLEWKLATGAQWVVFAHDRAMQCHIGRVGTAKRVRWAIAVGADSIDSCLPLWSRAQLQRFLEALGIEELAPRKTNHKAHFSSATDEWSTPRDRAAKWVEEFGIVLDVCATPENAVVFSHFTREHNGLEQDWARVSEGGACWMNPPYGRGIGNWVAKAASEARKGATVVCLLPARTDTKWWHDYVWDEARKAPRDGVSVDLLRGRLKFGSAKNSAPFPSAVVVFRGSP